MEFSYEKWKEIELPEEKSKYKNLLKRKGEDAVYAELKKTYKYKTVFRNSNYRICRKHQKRNSTRRYYKIIK